MKTENYYKYCSKKECKTCPLFSGGETDCRDVAEILAGCCGDGTTMAQTIRTIRKALEVIEKYGNSSRELDQYEKYCIDGAIGKLIEIEDIE